jgi:hypothetical protein
MEEKSNIQIYRLSHGSMPQQQEEEEMSHNEEQPSHD